MGDRRQHFETDPPNAVLAFLEPNADAPDDAVVVLKQPNLDGAGDLSYSIEVLEGTVPTHAGTGHAVHRPVRTAALAHLGVRNPEARAATDATTGVLTSRGKNHTCRSGPRAGDCGGAGD